MWDFLSEHANALMLALTVLGSFATWTYHKIRGDQTDSFDDVLRGVGKQVIDAVLADPKMQADAASIRTAVVTKLWDLAAKAGVPRNALTESVAQAIIEHTIGDILTELRARAALPAQISDLYDKAKAAVDEIDAARARGLAAVAGMKDLIEVQGPGSAPPTTPP